MAMSRKAGPPVPPRPFNTPVTGLLKCRNESPIIPVTRNSTAIRSSSSSSSAMITSSVISGNLGNSNNAGIAAGRTVIYKSPSFDLKKRQQNQQQVKFFQQQRQQFEQPSQRIEISPLSTSSSSFSNNNTQNLSKTNHNITKIMNKNTTNNHNHNNNNNFLEYNSQKIVLGHVNSELRQNDSSYNRNINNINNNNSNLTEIYDSNGYGKVQSNLNRPYELRRNRTEILIRNDRNEKLQNFNELTTSQNTNINNIHINNSAVKQIDYYKSPIPKPRTLISNTKHKTVNDNQRIVQRSHSTLCSITKSSPIIIKNIDVDNHAHNDHNNFNSNQQLLLPINDNQINTKNNIEIENNLKNAAERLFTEIIINQSSQTPIVINNNNDVNVKILSTAATTIPPTKIPTNHQSIVKTEHCISVRNTPSPTTSPINKSQSFKSTKHTQHQPLNKTCVNLLNRSDPDGECEESSCTKDSHKFEKPLANLPNSQRKFNSKTNQMNLLKSASTSVIGEDRKLAFHEFLIDEITAMRQQNHQTLIEPAKEHLHRIPPSSALNLDPEDDDNDEEFHDDPEFIEDFNQNNEKLTSNLCSGDNGTTNTNNNNTIIMDNIQKQLRKRYPSGCSTDSSPYGTQRSNTSSSRIRTSDWIEVGDNGKKVILTSCNISLEDSGLEDEIERLDDYSSGVGDSWDSVKDTNKRMILSGLPPLPKSLSGIDHSQGLTIPETIQIQQKDVNQIESSAAATSKSHNNINDINSYNDDPTKLTKTSSASCTLDNQLAILRREMYGLRQLDLSLLSQLWVLNDSIQEFRSLLQEQDTMSQHSISPTPSEVNSVSSDGEDETILSASYNQKPKQASVQQQRPNHQYQYPRQSQPLKQNRMRAAPPPPPAPTRKAPPRPI